METLIQWWHVFIDVVGASHPALLFVAMAVLPLAGMPVSPLWIAAGVRLGLVGGTALAFGALLVNLSCGYWLARGWLREPLRRWLKQRGHRIPRLEESDETQLILLLRVTPGLPLCVQNYVLGLAQVAFGRYLLLSLPVQAAYALAFVWFGNALFGSRPWQIILAVTALVAVGLAVNLLRRRLIVGRAARRAAANNIVR